MSHPEPEKNPDLSEPPRDEETDKELEKLNEAGGTEKESLRRTVSSVTDTVDQLSATVDLAVIKENAPPNQIGTGAGGRYAEPPSVATSALDPSPDLKPMTDAVAEVSQDAKKQPEEKKEWSIKRWLALALGGTALGAGIYLLVAYLKRQAENQPTSDLPALPQDTAENIKTLVKAWQDQPDAAYWGSLADYIDKNPGSLTPMDQAVFLRCTLNMCSNDVPFIWDSEQDKADYAQGLVSEAAAHDGNTAAMYRAVTARPYQDQPLTRAAAADVLLLAICWIYHLQTSTPAALRSLLTTASPRRLAGTAPQSTVTVLTTAGSDWSDALKAALTIAGNLAWLMPPPWGPLGSAATALIEMLLPGQADDPFQKAVTGLEKYAQLADLKKVASYLDSYSTWLQQLQAEMNLLGQPDADYITGKMEFMATATGPNGDLFSNTATLASLLTDVDDAFPVYMVAESLMVLSLKMVVQLQATLASLAEDANDDKEFTRQTTAWVDTYVELLVRTRGASGAPGCIEQVAAFIEQQCTARLSRIKAPYQYDKTVYRGPELPPASVPGWTFKDEQPGTGDDDMTHWVEGSSRTTIDQKYHDYVTGVANQLDTTYTPARRTLRAWQSAITLWQSHVPPNAPVQPPQIPDGSWGPPAPPGSLWTVNSKVRYAAMNVNASGPSKLSRWSPYTTLSGRAHPTLTLAADPQERSSAVRVYRQFASSTGGESPIRLIGISQGPDMLSYTDTAD